MNPQYSSRQATEGTSGLVKEFFSSLLGVSIRSFGPEGAKRRGQAALVASNTEVNAKDNHVMTSVHLAAAVGGSFNGSFTDANGVVGGFVASPNS